MSAADSRLWQDYCDRGSQAYQYGRLEVAEELYWRAVQEAKEFGEFDPRLAASLNNLAVVLRTRGRFEQVEDLYNLALRIWKVIDDHHECMAMSLNNAAGFHMTMGHHAEARQLYRRALAIYEDREQSEDYLLAACLSNLARLYVLQGKYQQAEPLYKRARGIAEKLLGKDHHCVALVLSGMGGLYTRLKKFSRAETLLERALRTLERTQGKQHPDVATCLVNLGDLFFEQLQAARRLAFGQNDKRERIEPLYNAALAIREKRLGSEHPECAHIYRKLGLRAESTNDLDRAEGLFRRALSIYLSSYGPYHFEVGNCLDECAQLMRKRRRYEEATRLEERATLLRQRQSEAARVRISVLDAPG